MTYGDLAYWVSEHYDLNNYSSPEELIAQVKVDFMIQNANYPEQAGDNIRELWQQTYDERHLIGGGYISQEQQQAQADRQAIADMFGGAMMQGMSEEIISSMNQPEIMGVDISNIATTREEPIQREIKKLRKPTIGTRIVNLFSGLFRRKR